MLRRLLALFALLALLPSGAGAYTWDQVTFSDSAFNGWTVTPGGYSSVTLYRGDFYSNDRCDNPTTSLYPQTGIYQNCWWKFNLANRKRILIDTNWWVFDTPRNRTKDTTQNLTHNTPPSRHALLAMSDSGKLYTMHGLNNKIMVNRAFVPGDVDLATNEITFSTTSPFTHLDEVDFVTSGALPTGLSAGVSYYVIYVSATKLKFATTIANARAGTAIDLNTSTGSGTDSLRRVVANHPSDVWVKDVVASPHVFTQIYPPADSMPLASGFTASLIFAKHQRKLLLTPASDNRGGSSMRTYLMDAQPPYAWHRLTQSYQNGDAPGVSSGQGCTYNFRDSTAWCFGGGNSSNPTNDLWKFSFTTQLWTKPTFTGKPRARVQHCLAYVPGTTSATDSLFITGGAASEGGTEYTDAFMCGIQDADCDSLPLSTVPPATAFTYCTWLPDSAKVLVKKADTSPSTVDQFWTMAMGSAVSALVTVDPSNATVTAPATAQFTVTATGTPAPTYQWQKNGTNVADGTGGTTATYTTAATSLSDNGATYRCIVTNDYGTDTSAAATLTVNTVPAITTHPSSASVVAPATAQFTCAASGSPTPTYQWTLNGSNIGGATSATYTTPATSGADDGGLYRCVATNAAGSATSNPATLTVTAVAVQTKRSGPRRKTGVGPR